jgi:hypothetical protein
MDASRRRLDVMGSEHHDHVVDRARAHTFEDRFEQDALLYLTEARRRSGRENDRGDQSD